MNHAPQCQQTDPQEYSSGIDAYVPDTRASARDKALQCLIHTGCQTATRQTWQYVCPTFLFFHGKQPTQQRTQTAEFQKVRQFPQTAVTISHFSAARKNGLQQIVQPSAQHGG